jgi:hypothetical protein
MHGRDIPPFPKTVAEIKFANVFSAFKLNLELEAADAIDI